MKNSANPLNSAEADFRRAFDRLKQGTSETLPEGTPVTQNNVAREAGRDPSALRKARYAALISEIQRWIRDHPQHKPQSQRQTTLVKRKENRELNLRIKEIEAQRDHAVSLLVEADTKILELTMENADLQAKLAGLEGPSANSKVSQFPRRR
ncbi:hypothetical protein [Paraburkholderia sp. MM5384-R2]|uniref:hypothetical protein n=1 Tax=Paraburkholderia sp. MM5384-R2 TaxID=2723097 RepID=UPI0016217374|nr:hypothetical protein [Paraburkholderia sp. MM5384-R2]MBB5502167.1 hypothetical protein [Paraburkholderia sp. MM5384-R2]